MKNIEIKQIIDGKLAVVMDGINHNDLPLGSANTYLNLDNILFFQTYKSNENCEKISVNREYIDNNKTTFIDGFPENSNLFEEGGFYSSGWDVKIPKNTPIINLVFPKFSCYLYFLHHGEYKKFMRVLTENNN